MNVLEFKPVKTMTKEELDAELDRIQSLELRVAAGMGWL